MDERGPRGIRLIIGHEGRKDRKMANRLDWSLLLIIDYWLKWKADAVQIRVMPRTSGALFTIGSRDRVVVFYDQINNV